MRVLDLEIKEEVGFVSEANNGDWSVSISDAVHKTKVDSKWVCSTTHRGSTDKLILPHVEISNLSKLPDYTKTRILWTIIPFE